MAQNGKGFIEQRPAAQMGGDDLEIRKIVNYPFQTSGMGIIKPLVAAVNQQRQLSLNCVIDPEQSLVISIETLSVGVQLDALKP